jgi:uncharacterized protein
MRGSGGTTGGIGTFMSGFALAAGSLWFFFDSVLVTSGGVGWVTSLVQSMHGQPSGAMGGWQTASMGIIFIPFVCGVIALFYDASKSWAWYLTYFGIFVLVVEILSRIQFVFSMKTSHLMLMLGAFAAGTALMFRSYRAIPPDAGTDPKQSE